MRFAIPIVITQWLLYRPKAIHCNYLWVAVRRSGLTLSVVWAWTATASTFLVWPQVGRGAGEVSAGMMGALKDCQ